MMQKTELFSDQPGDEGLPGRERGLAMAAVMTTTTMAVFDGSMVNIALPRSPVRWKFPPHQQSGSPTAIFYRRQ